ncbi:TPA: hypothetical protein N0F65_003243 [Lagenidium giganteum]|uniref:Integrase catalytic domain-containing protein n=1 Tax=Lagenidium giganteum TaxID=4803 RepID=A0AAV2ZAZ5_9STRA|nr:TPA: hypothetical protein N0F65_003243 [Lagenidium giganteum]
MLAKGTPESAVTASEKALGAIPPPALAAPAPQHTNCSYCDRPWHDIRQCRVLQKDLRDGNVKDGTVLPANFAFKVAQPNRYRPYDRDSSHDRQYGRPPQGTTVKPEIGLAAQVRDPFDPIWTIDSACTRRVTHQAEWFTASKPGEGTIMVGGKNEIPIEATGTVTLQLPTPRTKPRRGSSRTCCLHHLNLFFVHAAVKQDFRFTFKRTSCAVQTDQRFKITAKMADHADLFQFNALATKPDSAMIAHPGINKDIMLLHKRLGHPNIRVLQALPKSQAIRDLDVQTVESRVPFFHVMFFLPNRTVERVKFPLHKVHTDICGPLPVPSLSGSEYFVVFIDDYSRYMFTHPMKRRSEAYV